VSEGTDREPNDLTSAGALRRRMLVGFVVGGLLCVSSLPEFVVQNAAGYISLALGLGLVISGFVTGAKLRRLLREMQAEGPALNDAQNI
jgi:hypothetical protein